MTPNWHRDLDIEGLQISLCSLALLGRCLHQGPSDGHLALMVSKPER